MTPLSESIARRLYVSTTTITNPIVLEKIKGIFLSLTYPCGPYYRSKNTHLCLGHVSIALINQPSSSSAFSGGRTTIFFE